MPENAAAEGGFGRDAPSRSDNDNNRGGAREDRESRAEKAESFERAMDNANRPDRAPAAPSDTTTVADDDDDDNRNTIDKTDDRQDRGFFDRVADTLTAAPTDAEGNARSTSPVADRVRNHTQNYSLDDLRNVFTDDPGLTPEQSQALADGAAVMDGVAISEEFCTIEVRSKTISGVGQVEYGPYGFGPSDVGPIHIDRIEIGPIEQPAHAYVVTTDSVPRPDAYLGPVTIHRGGPESRTQSPVDGSVWGDIFTVSDRYEPGVPDYTTEERPAVTVGIFEGSCDPYDQALDQAGIDIQGEHHDYSPLGPNSNTAVSEMLNRTGLPDPDDYPGWTPGSHMDLPDGKVPTNPDRSDDWFWQRWL